MLRKLVIGIVLGALGSAPLSALPPRPGSTAEFAEANKQHIMATFTPVFQVDPATAEKNRRTAEAAWPIALRLMPAACAKSDAQACEVIATSQSLYSRLPSPKAARVQAAHRAIAIYGELCGAQAADSYRSDCRNFEDFLKKLDTADERDPRTATGMGGQGWLEYARVHEQICRAETEPSVYQGSACDIARSALGKSSPTKLAALNEHLCARNEESSCHALGRFTPAEEAEYRRFVTGCEAGTASQCNSAAATAAYDEWRSGWAADARKWARRSCELGDETGCEIAFEAAAAEKFGPNDLPLALDAAARICKMPAAKTKDRYCALETKVRGLMNKPG